MRVLVRALTLGMKRDDNYFASVNEDDHPECDREEFHMVDLNKHEFRRDILPPLLFSSNHDSIVALNEVIYVIGGTPYRGGWVKPPEETKHLFHRGGSKIKLEEKEVSEKRMWDELPRPINNCDRPVTVTLLGKIYNFGFYTPKTEVYDPAVGGGWEKHPLSLFPIKLSKSDISLHIVPDPSRKRILVHIARGPRIKAPSLYAFYPDGDGDGDGNAKWKCLDRKFYEWSNVMAVDADLLYFHDFMYPNFMKAYHLLNRKWLKVFWTKPSIHHIIKQSFTSMFPRDDASLCLANHVSFYTKDMTNITYLYFLKFTAEHSTEDANVLFLTPLRLQRFSLKNTSRFLGFLPLCN